MFYISNTHLEIRKSIKINLNNYNNKSYADEVSKKTSIFSPFEGGIPISPLHTSLEE